MSSPVLTMEDQLRNAMAYIQELEERVRNTQAQSASRPLPSPPRPPSLSHPQPRYPSQPPPSPHYQPRSPRSYVPPAPAPVTKMPRFALPPMFSGKMADAESFENSCKLYIGGREAEFPTDKIKIFWILGFLQTGLAAEWRDNIIRLIHANNEPFEDYDGFWEVFRQSFGDPDIQSTKVLKLRTIEQGTLTADEHVQAFMKVAYDSGYTGIPLVMEFKRSLNKALRDKLTHAEIPPVTIKQWYDRARIVDRQWRQAKAEERLFSGTSHPKQAQASTSAPQAQGNRNFVWNRTQPQQAQAPPVRTAPANPPPARDPNAMDVDRSQRGPPVCYKCRKPGHRAFECRSRLDVRNMTYDDIMNHAKQYFEEKKDFPTGDK